MFPGENHRKYHISKAPSTVLAFPPVLHPTAARRIMPPLVNNVRPTVSAREMNMLKGGALEYSQYEYFYPVQLCVRE